jgi:hypothetical protein
MKHIFILPLIFLLTISSISVLSFQPVSAQTVGSQITTTTLVIPYMNPYYFTIQNGTLEYVAVQNSPTSLTIYPLDNNHNPKLDTPAYTYTSISTLTSGFGVGAQGVAGMIASAFVSDGITKLYLECLYVGSGATLGTILAVGIQEVVLNYNTTTSQWEFNGQSTKLSVQSTTILSDNVGSQIHFSVTGSSFGSLTGIPTIIFSTIATTVRSGTTYNNWIVIGITPTTVSYLRQQINSGAGITTQHIKTCFIGNDNVDNANMDIHSKQFRNNNIPSITIQNGHIIRSNNIWSTIYITIPI